MEYAVLSKGVKMPILGYGVYQVTKEECERCVLDALQVGYRHIDTAQSYFNEEEVGSAIQKSGWKRGLLLERAAETLLPIPLLCRSVRNTGKRRHRLCSAGRFSAV